MKIIFNTNKLIRILDKEKNIGFVPTMGAIHRGHIYLVKKSLAQNNKTVVSIFVNKPQFNKKNDFINYPRVLENDKKILKNLKIDYLFIPTQKQIYPDGVNKKIKINSFKKKLCGKFRPNHFEAVVDVVDRFINIIKPKRIYLGNKDMQQLILIKDYVEKNKLNTKVIACRTVRQNNGIALSSRNLLLSNNDKIIASKVYKTLKKFKKKMIYKKKFINTLKKNIFNLGVKKIDYLEFLDINKLIKPYKKISNKKLFIAYYIKSVRLIDNV